jgi:hypothetical protein
MDTFQETHLIHKSSSLHRPLRTGIKLLLALMTMIAILGLTFNFWFSAIWGFLDSVPRTNAVALGDLDGDMDLDAFYANGKPEVPQTNNVLINQGGLQGGHPASFKDSGQRLGEDLGRQVLLADLDGDRDLDVLVGGIPRINEYINTGYGYFEAKLGWVTGIEGYWALALGDLDGDGDTDILAAGCCGPFNPYQATWYNQGGAQGGNQGVFFESDQHMSGLGAEAVALGDLDGDGDLDAFLGNNFITDEGGELITGQPNLVAWNDGKGVFRDSNQRLGSAMTKAVALADLDNDGDLDAYSGNYGPDEIWLNTGGAQGRQPGLFVDSGQRLGDGYTRRVFLADLNGDGYMDVAAEMEGDGPWGSASLEIHLNDGQGNFPTLSQQLSNFRAQAFDLGDLDGDGDLDVFAGWYEHGYAIWWNTGSGRLE